MTWLLVTSGRGPEECQLAVAGISAALVAEALAAGLVAEAIDSEPGSRGPVSVLVSVGGPAGTISAFAASWEGTVLWACPSPLRKVGRKRWFVGVARLEPPPPAAAFREADLRFEACRASGPGGQHVNKTNSAVRVTHLPTGMVATAQEERSQHRNKALAVARLVARLAGIGERAGEESVRERRGKHDMLERGNQVRAYEGPGFRRAT